MVLIYRAALKKGGVAEWFRRGSAKPFTVVRIHPHASGFNLKNGV